MINYQDTSTTTSIHDLIYKPPKQKKSDKGPELFYASQEIKQSMQQMQTLTARMRVLEDMERKVKEKAELSAARQRRREEAIRRNREKEEQEVRRQAEFEVTLEHKKVKFGRLRKEHVRKLSAQYTEVLENRKKNASLVKQNISVDIIRARRAQQEEELRLKERNAQIAERIRNSIKARALKSKSQIETVRSSYEAKLEDKLQIRDRMRSKIAIMEQKERELLERLKSTQQMLLGKEEAS